MAKALKLCRTEPQSHSVVLSLVSDWIETCGRWYDDDGGENNLNSVYCNKLQRMDGSFFCSFNVSCFYFSAPFAHPLRLVDPLREHRMGQWNDLSNFGHWIFIINQLVQQQNNPPFKWSNSLAFESFPPPLNNNNNNIRITVSPSHRSDTDHKIKIRHWTAGYSSRTLSSATAVSVCGFYGWLDLN